LKKNKRLLILIATFCFSISCFSPIHSYAKANTVTSDKAAASKGQVATVKNTKATEKKEDIKDTENTEAGKEDKKASETPEGKESSNSTPPGPEVKTTTPPGIEVKDKNPDEEDLWYRKQNPMKKEHQKLLWDYCKQRKVNYIDMLALIYTESNFKEKCSTGKYFGYFQISKGNCANLAAKLKTKNTPLDGAININWGTAMYSWILADKRVKNLEGDKKKRDAALSIYQRGTGGYDKYGISTSFLKTYYKKRDIVSKWYEVKK
jgi:hypothetical protein